jgi:hypothetical protein
LVFVALGEDGRGVKVAERVVVHPWVEDEEGNEDETGSYQTHVRRPPY